MEKCEAARLMKKRLQKRGWCRGKTFDDEGRSCLLGLMMEKPVFRTAEYFPLYNYIAQKCWDMLPNGEVVTDDYNSYTIAKGMEDKNYHPTSIIIVVNNTLLDEESVAQLINDAEKEFCNDVATQTVA